MDGAAAAAAAHRHVADHDPRRFQRVFAHVSKAVEAMAIIWQAARLLTRCWPAVHSVRDHPAQQEQHRCRLPEMPSIAAAF
jgi:hypothetical protein